MTDDDDTPPSPAESRVSDLLGDVREGEVPPPRAGFDDRLMRTARWQYATRGALAAAGELAAVVGTGLAYVLGARREGEQR